MSRPARYTVDLAALRRNYRRARELNGGPVLAVLKANAYGHGAVRCARALAGLADGFAVAFLEEAVALRQAGIGAPILLLQGVFDKAEMLEAIRWDLWTVVRHLPQIELIEACVPTGSALNVWLKVDTGMARAGFVATEARSAHERLMRSVRAHRVSSVTWMTHFARADDLDAPTTPEQIDRFEAIVRGLPGERSLANSAGLLAWPQARGGWGRAGIMLYGASPIAQSPVALEAVMTLESRVIGVQDIPPGAPVGYGGTFVADRPMRVGLVAMGYADGYPRLAPSGTPVSVDGRPSQLLGRVSMDMLTVDLTGLDGAAIGSRVELWGCEVAVGEVARRAGTIAYELLCNVKRVHGQELGLQESVAAEGR